jgi:hypothetical protein
MRPAAFIAGLYISQIYAFIPAPSLQPLQYIQIPVIGQILWEQLGTTVWDSVFPEDLDDAVAISISEGASGFVGGVALKLASLIDGNKDSKDSTLTNGGATGIFFATRGGLRALGEFIGASTILVSLGTLLVATILSEVVKLRGRAVNQQQTRVGDGPTMMALMKFRNPSMKTLMQFKENESKFKNVKFMPRPDRQFGERRNRIGNEIPITSEAPMLGKSSPIEIISDMVKWFSYAILAPDVAYVPWEVSANCGALAGIISQLVKEGENKDKIRLSLPILEDEDSVYARLPRAAFEGAVQFLTYEVTRQWLLAVAPNPERFLHAFDEIQTLSASLYAPL